MKYLFLLPIIFTISCSCKTYQHECGDLIPVISDRHGRNRSLDGHICHYDLGKWAPIPTGPWYECKCNKESK